MNLLLQSIGILKSRGEDSKDFAADRGKFEERLVQVFVRGFRRTTSRVKVKLFVRDSIEIDFLQF